MENSLPLGKTAKRVLFYFLVVLSFSFTQEVDAQDVIYVDSAAMGSGDGTSWTDAYTAIQPALDAATPWDSIWVAKGTYKPSKDASGDSSPSDTRTKTFQLIDKVSLFGGFDGTESNIKQRDIRENVTLLCGDLGTEGDSTDNCYHVIYGADSLTIDGFTITKGNADGPSNSSKEGAGMRNESGATKTVSLK